MTKIIRLSRTPGMMVYGDLMFMGVPMPTVVAKFLSLKTSYATVEEAGNAFVAFLRTFPYDEEERLPNFYGVLSTGLKSFCDRTELRIEQLGLNQPLTFKKAFDAAVAAEIRRLSEDPYFDAVQIASIERHYPT